MTLDALRLEVPDILEENAMPLASLPSCLLQARGLAQDAALREVLELLFRLNREHGAGLFIVTHDEQLAARCQLRLHLDAGRLNSTAGAPL